MRGSSGEWQQQEFENSGLSVSSLCYLLQAQDSLHRVQDAEQQSDSSSSLSEVSVRAQGREPQAGFSHG